MLDREPNPETRRNIRHTIQKVNNENSKVRSMREALVKAHRSGDVNEIKDIHSFIREKKQYE